MRVLCLLWNGRLQCWEPVKFNMLVTGAVCVPDALWPMVTHCCRRRCCCCTCCFMFISRLCRTQLLTAWVSRHTKTLDSSRCCCRTARRDYRCVDTLAAIGLSGCLCVVDDSLCHHAGCNGLQCACCGCSKAPGRPRDVAGPECLRLLPRMQQAGDAGGLTARCADRER